MHNKNGLTYLCRTCHTSIRRLATFRKHLAKKHGVYAESCDAFRISDPRDLGTPLSQHEDCVSDHMESPNSVPSRSSDRITPEIHSPRPVSAHISYFNLEIADDSGRAPSLPTTPDDLLSTSHILTSLLDPTDLEFATWYALYPA